FDLELSFSGALAADVNLLFSQHEPSSGTRQRENIGTASFYQTRVPLGWPVEARSPSGRRFRMGIMPGEAVQPADSDLGRRRAHVLQTVRRNLEGPGRAGCGFVGRARWVSRRATGPSY